MRTACWLLFLGFYLASTVTSAQEKIALALEQLEHSASQNQETQIHDNCDETGLGLPRYREAKKAGLDFDFRQSLTVVLALPNSVQKLHSHVVSLESRLISRTIPSRAPPASL